MNAVPLLWLAFLGLALAAVQCATHVEQNRLFGILHTSIVVLYTSVKPFECAIIRRIDIIPERTSHRYSGCCSHSQECEQSSHNITK